MTLNLVCECPKLSAAASQKIAEVLHIEARPFPTDILYMQFEEQLTSYFKSQNLWQTNCFMC